MKILSILRCDKNVTINNICIVDLSPAEHEKVKINYKLNAIYK